MSYEQFVNRPLIKEAEKALLKAIVELKELHWTGFVDATGWNRTYCFLASKNLQEQKLIAGRGKYVATERGKILEAIRRGKESRARYAAMPSIMSNAA